VIINTKILKEIEYAIVLQTQGKVNIFYIALGLVLGLSTFQISDNDQAPPSPPFKVVKNDRKIVIYSFYRGSV